MLKHLANLTIFRSMTRSAIWPLYLAFKSWSCGSAVVATLVAPALLSPTYAQQTGLSEMRVEVTNDTAVSSKTPKGVAKKKLGQKTGARCNNFGQGCSNKTPKRVVSKKGPPQGSTSGIEWSFDWNSTGATNNKPKSSKALTIKKGSMKFILTDGIDARP